MRPDALLGDTSHITHYFLQTCQGLKKRPDNQIYYLACTIGSCRHRLLSFTSACGTRIVVFAPVKAAFPCKAFFHAALHHYLEDHQPGAEPVQLCLHLCKMGWCGNVFLGGGWGGLSKVVEGSSATEESAPFPKFLARQPASERCVSAGDASLSPPSRSFSANLELWSPALPNNHFKLSLLPPSLHPSPSLLPTLSCGNAPLTDLYQQTHPCTGSPFAFVVFHRPGAEPGWGICVHFPLQLFSPNVKLV